MILLAAAAEGSGNVLPVLIDLVLVLLAAKFFGELTLRLGQPAVLGELVAGILLGNFLLPLVPDLEEVTRAGTFNALAELGAIFLLFEVGLHSTTREMLSVGGRALLVAVLGVLAPMLLGFGVGAVTHPGHSWMLYAFFGAMLSATSVGITARVLGEARALKSPEARIILGAAVIDDVLGLVVLAVVSGIITAAAAGSVMSATPILWIILKAVLFLAGALAIGGLVTPHLFRASLRLRSEAVAQTLSLAFCLLVSWVALRVGLAPIVGAFAAGLVLEDVHFEGYVRRGERPIAESLSPVLAFFVPVFFVRMGMMVDLRAFLDTGVLAFALLLTAAAGIGKWVCGLGVARGMSRITVGLGMMPRGEVGLIFAGIGRGLLVDGAPVVDDATYAAAVFMIVATTLVTPPLLLWSLKRTGVAPPGSGGPRQAH